MIIWILALVILAAFFLLLWVQMAYLRNAHKMRNEQFLQLANSALERVTYSIELEELNDYLTKRLTKDSINDVYQVKMESGETISLAYIPAVFTLKPISHSNKFGQSYVESSQFSTVRDQTSQHCYPWLPINPNDVTELSTTVSRRQRTVLGKYAHKRKQIDELILRSLMVSDSTFIRRLQSISPESIIRTIRLELRDVGITTPFYYKLYYANGYLISESGMANRYRGVKSNETNTIRQLLFAIGNQPDEQTAFLDVTFPEKEDYVSSYTFVIPVGISFLVVMFVAVWALRILFRQQRFAESKTDFINNMTHELKTPVSSISLAGQMLRDPSIIEKKESVDRLVWILNSESKRLSMLIDKVLQFSLFEDKRIRLKLKEIDANELILNVAEIYTFKTQQTGGDLSLELEAENTWLMADEMHFTNALFNLMENAVKYRQEKIPLLLNLRTYNVGRKFALEIQDNGIGIPKDSLQMIFDKFYRVPTGNRQNVRGFGLGLAYVRKVIQEMKGSIRAESQLGKGTRMIVELPISEQN